MRTNREENGPRISCLTFVVSNEGQRVSRKLRNYYFDTGPERLDLDG